MITILTINNINIMSCENIYLTILCNNRLTNFTIWYKNEKYTFEVGGKNKDFSQIKDADNSFVVADGIEVGFKNKIPLWLFGFLY